MIETLIPSPNRVFVKSVHLRNYKSIESCGVDLHPLTLLVGRNGAGKSNFLDALRFVADGLQTSLDHAIKSRGGIDAVRRRSTGHPRNFAVEFEMELSDWRVASYGFEIASRTKGGYLVREERLVVKSMSRETEAFYEIQRGDEEIFRSSVPKMPPSTPDRLYLVTASGLPEFRPVYDLLLSMGFYNLNPAAMRELQSPDAGELLHRDGSNVASVVARLSTERPDAKSRIRDYLETIVPEITDIERVALGPKETLEFRQRVVGAQNPWRFYANSMSDGTLRALGTLVAIAQIAEPDRQVRLVGIEEPETALHPAAAAALIGAIREACTHTQIIVTTHSPELLDEVDIQHEGLLVAESREGTTKIAPVDSASLSAIKEQLYTAGELLRMDQLAPDPRHIEGQEQLSLFGDREDLQ